jgi:hypothetical protein
MLLMLAIPVPANRFHIPVKSDPVMLQTSAERVNEEETVGM